MAKKKIKKTRKRFKALSVELNESHKNIETGIASVDIVFDLVNDQNYLVLANSGEIIPSNSLINGYLGENKARILSEIPTEQNDNSFDLIKKLQKYDRIVAIDTNSSFHSKHKISLGIAVHIIGKINPAEINWEIITINHLFFLIGEADKIENRNWMELIKYAQSHKNYDPSHKIGLVVDSDLGNIKDYNNRQKPIIGSFYLPPNFELIFASDKANDNILNHAISTCHKKSKDILELYIETLEKNDTNEL